MRRQPVSPPLPTSVHYAFGLQRNPRLRRLALKGTEWAQSQVDTIRRKLFKIGAIVRVSVRRVVLEMSSAIPGKISTRALMAPCAVEACPTPRQPKDRHTLAPTGANRRLRARSATPPEPSTSAFPTLHQLQNILIPPLASTNKAPLQTPLSLLITQSTIGERSGLAPAGSSGRAKLNALQPHPPCP